MSPDAAAAAMGRAAPWRLGALYFAAVFAAGFVLGVPRTLWLEPRFGALAAVALELPLMLGLAWLVCRRLLRTRTLGPAQAWAIGATAFGLLMAAEALLSLTLGGRSVAAHLALYAEPAHQLGLAGQLLFAAFPWLQARRAA